MFRYEGTYYSKIDQGHENETDNSILLFNQSNSAQDEGLFDIFIFIACILFLSERYLRLSICKFVCLYNAHAGRKQDLDFIPLQKRDEGGNTHISTLQVVMLCYGPLTPWLWPYDSHDMWL